MNFAKKNLLENLYIELKDKKFTISKAFPLYLQASSKNVKFDPTIESLWDELLDWIPSGVIKLQEHRISLKQKLSMADWFEELKRATREGILDQPVDDLSFPTIYNDVKIWGDEKELFYVDPDTNVYVDQYWRRIFRYLGEWQRCVNLQIDTVSWMLDELSVNFITTWTGEFVSITQCEIPGVLDDYWQLEFSKNVSSRSSIVSNALLLRAQLTSLLAGNILEASVSDSNSLTLSLKMQRADITSSLYPDNHLGKSSVDSANRFINSSIILGYIDISQRLETALLNELDKLKSIRGSNQIDQEWVVRFQDTLTELVLVRKQLVVMTS